jgi:hypothetical protein
MSNPPNEPLRFVTCPCQHCDGHIEFDASDFTKDETRTVECPHCHLETVIFVPKEKAAKPMIDLVHFFKKRKRLILALATIFLICVIVIWLSSLSSGEASFLILALAVLGVIWAFLKSSYARGTVDQLDSAPSVAKQMSDSALASPPQAASGFICESCGTLATPTTITKGSLGLEFLLWCFCLLPGMIYSAWRLSSRCRGCPSCGGKMLKVDSPRGKLLFQQLHKS